MTYLRGDKFEDEEVDRKKTVCVQRWAFMLAVLNLGVLLR